MLAAQLGARVALFDAQPSCWRFIETAIAQSGRFPPERVQLVRGGVSTREHDVRISLTAGADKRHLAWQKDCDGHFGQRGRSNVVTDGSHAAGGSPAAAPAATNTDFSQVLLASERIAAADFDDDAFRDPRTGQAWTTAFALDSFREGMLGRALADGTDITLVKLDVEGAELGILNGSLLPLLRQRRVRHLIMEATPGFWNTSTLGETHSRAFAVRLARSIAGFGYSLQTRMLVKRCQRATGPASQSLKSCWLWDPKSIGDYVASMRDAEDLAFERIEQDLMLHRRTMDAESPMRDPYQAWCGAHTFRLALRSGGAA